MTRAVSDGGVGGASLNCIKHPMKVNVEIELSSPKYPGMSSVDKTKIVPKTNAKPTPIWLEFNAIPVARVRSFSGNHTHERSVGVH
mmetsp:Transcript_2442/g.4557  ORF Transcript_2442/g.4557 Transcript_2442/m.4557 type:complete len:86 (+) Transcript_2442:445-702(+)